MVGDLSSFEPRLVALIAQAEELTAANTRLTLTVAANYGGRWDIMQAVNRMLKDHPDRSGGFNEAHLAPYLALSYAPEPDLFIRTGGEQRVSNFCLWQLAYTELYFTDDAVARFRRRGVRARRWPPTGSASGVSAAPASSSVSSKRPRLRCSRNRKQPNRANEQRATVVDSVNLLPVAALQPLPRDTIRAPWRGAAFAVPVAPERGSVVSVPCAPPLVRLTLPRRSPGTES